jgi:hypothetical protein
MTIQNSRASVHNDAIDVYGEYILISMHPSNNVAFTPETPRVGGPPDQEKGSVDSSIASYFGSTRFNTGPRDRTYRVPGRSTQLFQTNSGLMLLNRPHFLPSTLLPVNYSTISLPFHAT